MSPGLLVAVSHRQANGELCSRSDRNLKIAGGAVFGLACGAVFRLAYRWLSVVRPPHPRLVFGGNVVAVALLLGRGGAVCLFIPLLDVLGLNRARLTAAARLRPHWNMHDSSVVLILSCGHHESLKMALVLQPSSCDGSEGRCGRRY